DRRRARGAAGPPDGDRGAPGAAGRLRRQGVPRRDEQRRGRGPDRLPHSPARAGRALVRMAARMTGHRRYMAGAGSRPGVTRAPALAGVALAALAASCAPDVHESTAGVTADQVNQLQGHPAEASPGGQRAERISDGILAPAGDFWNTPMTALLPSPAAFITVDLGAPVTVAALFVEGDNNDRYIVAGSMDGQSFTTIWEAPPVTGAGMRPRRSDRLSAQARYIRLSAAGGDGAYSVGELEVFSIFPSVWPEPSAGSAAAVEGPLLAEWIMFFGVACVVFLFLGCTGSPARGLVVGGLPALALILLLSQIGSGDRSFNDHDVSFLRAMLAAIGIVAVVRPFVWLAKGAVDGRRITALLGVL